MNPDSPSTAASASVFHLPEGIRYACQMEGLCCRDSWEIRVEADAAERVLGTDWRTCSSLDEKADSPFEPSRSNAKHLLFRRVGDACGFLGQDNRCRLHTRYGFEVKPHVCQRFPFRFIETPGGVYVGFSFACNSILNEIGPPVAESRDEAVRIYEHEPEHVRIESPIRLDATTTISWEEYLEIEKALDEILAREDRSVALCLVAGHVWLGMLRRMLQTAAAENARGGDAGKKPAQREVLRHYAERTRADGYARAFSIAERPVAHPTLKRMVLGTFLSFRNSLRPRQWRLAAIARVVFENARHWARIGSLRMEPLEKRVPYRLFHPTPAVLNPPETQKLLRRYFRHALFRKDLVVGTDLFWGYCYFLMTHGMIEYYATGLEALGEPDAKLALSLVEKYFVHHSSFGRTFLYHPAIADTLQYVFKRPNFAHTVVLG